MIRIAEFFQPNQESLIRLVRQCGVTDVVGAMDWSEGTGGSEGAPTLESG